MKSQTLFFVAAAFILLAFSNCKKTKTDPQIPQPPPEPILLLDTLYVYESVGGTLDSAAHVFTYDSEGRLTEARKDNVREYSISYNADGISGITLYNTMGNPFMTAQVPGTLIVNEDSISYHYTIQGQFGVIDTIRESFLFNDSLLLEQRFHFTSPDPNRNYSSSFVYTYNASGNLEECRARYSINYFTQWRVTGVDNRKNVWNSMPLAYVFGRYFDVSSTGLNNVTSVDWGNNNIESWEWTYNDEGYPLTVKSTSQDYVRLRFIYREKQ